MNIRTPLKDQLFTLAKVEQVAAELSTAHSAFAAGRFTRDVLARFPELELKARIEWMVECLATHLPDDYRKAVGIILAALPPPNDPTLSDGDFGDFIYTPYAGYVARHGCTAEHLPFSLEALRQITMRISAEDAIRPFINAFPTETLDTLTQWAYDDHYHVRRLCTEGTRPLLPWSRRLTTPPTYAVGLLDTLHADPTRFVTRSVANHINDLAKLDPDLALDQLRAWRDAGRQKPRELDFIIRHASRTLVKRGHSPTLAFLGVQHEVPITLVRADIPGDLPLGTPLTFSAVLVADRDADTAVSYRLRLPDPNGRLTRQRTYQLKRVRLAAGRPTLVTKTHPLPTGMTTLPIHPGTAELHLLVNGQVAGSWPITITSTES